MGLVLERLGADLGRHRGLGRDREHTAGATTDQIADELHIARETVRNHVRGVLAELRVHSRVEAIAAARAAGLLDD
jgi:two-component system nitrate/nitrite response regulator NarL